MSVSVYAAKRDEENDEFGGINYKFSPVVPFESHKITRLKDNAEDLDDDVDPFEINPDYVANAGFRMNGPASRLLRTKIGLNPDTSVFWIEEIKEAIEKRAYRMLLDNINYEAVLTDASNLNKLIGLCECGPDRGATHVVFA